MIKQFRILILISCIICCNLNLLAQIGGTDCASAVNININACSTSASFLATQGVNGNANMNASCGGLAVKVGAWFKFTTAASPPATISTTITVNGSAQALAGRNLAIELYQDAGCPTAPTYMSCAESGVTNPEVIVATLNASTTYYIRIVNVGTGSAFNIASTFVCVKQTPPNDVVGGAIPLAVGNGTCNNTVYGVSSHSIATNSSGSGADCWPNPTCGTYAAGSNDVWFSTVVPASGNFFIQTQGTAGTQDYGMAVYSSSVCGTASVLGCSAYNPEGLGGSVNFTRMPTLNITGAVPTSTVYIRVWKESGTMNTFSICVNDMGPCGNLPNNDFCSNPTSINTTSGAPGVAYNQTGITYTTDKPGNLQTTTQYGTAPCVVPVNNAWYSFIATASDASGVAIPFSIGASCTNVSATIFSVTTSTAGCCKEFTKIVCGNAAAAAGGTFTITVPSGSLTAGNTYYLMVNQSGTANPACQYTITGWSIAGILPVEFVSFVGNNEGKHNLLEWVTASEKNMVSYTLQHSADATNFTDLVTLNARNDQGNTKYTAYDEDAFEDVTYYRVKQLDLNGVEKYTNTISVSLKSMYDNIYNIHPNPTTNNLNFEYYSKSNNSISMELINYAGASVIKLNQPLEEGKNNITLPISEFDKGVYLLKVISEKSGKTTHHKIIKN